MSEKERERVVTGMEDLLVYSETCSSAVLISHSLAMFVNKRKLIIMWCMSLSEINFIFHLKKKKSCPLYDLAARPRQEQQQTLPNVS